MAIDPNRWTLKTQEAFAAAADLARTREPRRGHPRPSAGRPGGPARGPGRAPARPGRGGADGAGPAGGRAARASWPRPTAAAQPSMAARRAGCSTTPTRPARRHGRRVPVGRAPAAGPGRPDRGRAATSCWPRCRQVRGSHRVTSQNPEEQYQALERYGRDLTEAARQGKLDPVIGRDEEIRRVIQVLVPADQEQPRPHRRARGGQDGHRRGPGQPDRRGRRPRGARATSGWWPSTSPPWWPGPSTAASSRSG